MLKSPTRFVHKSWCNRANHTIHSPESGFENEPCVSELIEVGAAAGWLDDTESGPVVVLDVPSHSLSSLADAAEFGRKIMELTERAGRIGVPAPRVSVRP